MKNKNKNKNGCKKPRATRKMKTPYQLQKLKEAYSLEIRPPVREQRNLGESIGLTQKQVQTWFIHQRLNDRRKHSAKIDNSVGESVDHLASRSGSGSSSDSSQSNQPMEAADTIGQIVSHQPLTQTVTSSEIEPCIEEKVTTRVEKEVKTRVSSRVDSLRKDVSESCRQELIDCCVAGGGGGGVVSVVGGGCGGHGGGDGSGIGDLKNQMINMLTERNKRDKAKYQSLLNEAAALRKSIEATDKLINDIKEVC